MSHLENIKEHIDLENLPKHIAIIMDGNGRWAKKMGRPRVFGHRNGVKAVREVSEASAELGIEYLTLYAFSTENWNRPALEVNALMSLLVDTVSKELNTLQKNEIKLNCIGDVKNLPKRSYEALMSGIEKTKNNTRMTLTLALNYSSRWEVIKAARDLAHKAARSEIDPDHIDEDLYAAHLSTAGMPDPELLIRTSGEKRISNFLLYQLAYAELYFSEVLWPDYNREELYTAIHDYQQRERRFGKISEQLH